MNLMLAIALFAVAYWVGWPTPTAMSLEIANVRPESPAQAAGLLAGDRIIAVDDQPVRTLEDLQRVTRAHAGQTVAFHVERTDGSASLPVTLRQHWSPGAGPLGVELQAAVLESRPIAYPVPEAVAKGTERAWQLVALTLSVPWLLQQGVIAPDDVRPIGIVGMAQLAGQAAVAVGATAWFFPLLTLTALFSAGLAVANLLPLPGLDGGRLLFLAIEAVRGRRIAPERAQLLHAVGIALLLALMGVLIIADIVTPAPTIDWGAWR
jgi:regulator of sigma E protease